MDMPMLSNYLLGLRQISTCRIRYMWEIDMWDIFSWPIFLPSLLPPFLHFHSFCLCSPPSFSLCNQNISTAHILSFTYVQDGNTALLWAAWRGHVAVVKLLLHEHADVSLCDEVCTSISVCTWRWLSVYGLLRASGKGGSECTDTSFHVCLLPYLRVC